MADQKISSLTELAATPANDDLLVIVDTSDTTQAPTGTTKKIQASNARAGLALSGAVTSSGLTMATARLLGRTTASTGAVEEISVSGATLSGGVLTIASSSYVLLQDRKTQGTNGGTFTSGARRTRDLNTEVADTGNVCTLSANQFTLLAGTYRIRAVIPACRVNLHQAWLYNVTDASDTLISMVGFSANTGGDGHDYAFLSGTFTIAGTKTFEIQHQCGTTVANIGFGNGGSGTSFDANYFTTVELWVV